MDKKIEKEKIQRKIFPFEFVVGNSHYCQDNTCDGRFIYYQIAVGFHISLRETFSKTVLLIVLTKSNKGPFMQISQVFGTL